MHKAAHHATQETTLQPLPRVLLRAKLQGALWPMACGAARDLWPCGVFLVAYDIRLMAP